jgi:hypothetical protein
MSVRIDQMSAPGVAPGAKGAFVEPHKLLGESA